jgi:hypothetical protein
MIATRHDTTYGRSARNRLAAIETPGLHRAAVQS